MPKHKGLTGFIVDMHAPGVEVRPLRQMTGGASFNEVFFTDVRVRDDHRLGDVNQGWTVALTTLMNERASIGAGGAGGSSMASTTRLIEMVRHYGLDEDPITRQALADLIIRTKVASYTNQRAMDKIKMGQLPGPEMSIAKLALTQNMTKTAEFVANVLGARMVADSGEWGTYAWGQFVMGIPGMRIAGGSDEVMRNIVGERVLGLPKDAGIDSTTPFRDLKVGTQTNVMKVHVDDVDLYFDVAGAKRVPDGAHDVEDRPTLVLLHGGPGFDHTSWADTMGPLSEWAQVVVYDHRGNGRSDAGPREKWTLEQWGDDVASFCDALDIEKPVVVGSSFGGFVAMSYAGRHPDHPSKLVLDSTSASLDIKRMFPVFDRLGGPAAVEAARKFWTDPSRENLRQLRADLPARSTAAGPTRCRRWPRWRAAR